MLPSERSEKKGNWQKTVGQPVCLKKTANYLFRESSLNENYLGSESRKNLRELRAVAMRNAILGNYLSRLTCTPADSPVIQ